MMTDKWRILIVFISLSILFIFITHSSTPSWTTTPPYQMPVGAKLKIENINAIHQSLYNAAVNAATQSILPTGGTVGQALVKGSSDDFDVEWSDVTEQGTDFQWEIGYPEHEWKFNASYSDNNDYNLHLRYKSDTIDKFTFHTEGYLSIWATSTFPILNLNYDSDSDGVADSYSQFRHTNIVSTISRSDTDKYFIWTGGSGSSGIVLYGRDYPTYGDHLQIYAGTSTLALDMDDAGNFAFKAGHLTVESGDINIDAGDLDIDVGNIVLDNGNINLTTGEVTLTQGAVVFEDFTPSITTNKLYNDSGTLYFDGSPIGGGSLATLTDVDLTGIAQGDVLYYDGSDWVNLGPGTAGQALITQGAGANPQWGDVATDKPDKIFEFPAGSFDVPNGVSYELAPYTFDDGDNYMRLFAHAFDGTTNEVTMASMILPPDLNTAGGATFEITGWANDASGDVIFCVKEREWDDSTNWEGAFNEVSSGAKTVDSGTGQRTRFTWSETINNLGWQANDTVFFLLERDAEDGSDTLSSDFNVTHLRIFVGRE